MKNFGMQLPRKFFDGGNDSWRRPIDGIADHCKMMIAHGIQKPPAGTCSQRIEITLGGVRVRCSEHQIVRLQVNNLFQAHLRPIDRRFDDGNGAGFAEHIGDKSILASGNERLSPDDKQDTARRYGGKLGLQRGEPTLKNFPKRLAGVRGTKDIGQFLRRRKDLVNRVRIGSGITRDAKCIKGPDGVEAIDALRDHDQIRAQRGNFLEIGIDDAAHFGFFLSVGRIITKIRVPHEVVLQAKGINRLGDAWRKRNNARRRDRDFHASPHFIHHFTGGRRRRWPGRIGLREDTKRGDKEKRERERRWA